MKRKEFDQNRYIVSSYLTFNQLFYLHLNLKKRSFIFNNAKSIAMFIYPT